MFKTDMSTTEVMLTDSQRTALDHALADARECLERDGGMCPFSVLCTSDGFVVTDHPGEGVDDIYNSVRALLAQELPEAYVLCYDGFVDLDSGRTDAIVCEIARRGEAFATLLAQVYEVEDGVYHFADAPASAGTAKPLYPRGTKPIVSGLAAQGRYQEALALIKRENPLPAVCGRVCNRRCEDACTRGAVDQAIAIDEVKKFIADQDLNADMRYIPAQVRPKVGGDFEEKVAIIGAGPAGLSCAFYLAEKGYHPVVFEKNARPGGMLTYGIPSYKLEKDVVQAEVDVIEAMGAEFRYGVEVGCDVTLDELRAQGFKAFYVAIGCQGGRRVGVPGEDAEGVSVAVDFLRQVSEAQANGGEAAALSGTTVVVGGGNVAIDVARTAARLGSERVEMLCLESEAEMPASKDEQREATEDGVAISHGWGPKEILVGEDGRVRGITFKRCVSVFNDEGRFAPVYDEDDIRTFECNRVVLSIGQAIVWGDLLAGSKVELGRGQGAVADPKTYQTAEPDIFVGGDVYTGPKFAIDAIAAGHEAAVSIHRFVQEGTLTIGRNPRAYRQLDRTQVEPGEYDTAQRNVPAVDHASEHERPFAEYVRTFTEEQVRAETARCLGCGASVVDENKCIGCGLCTTKCAFDAIHLYRERPECSTMVKYEKKIPSLAKYALAREIKIRFGKR